MAVWTVGTLLLTLLIVFDRLIGAGLSGGLFYATWLFGPFVGGVGAIATPFSKATKVLLIIVTVCVIPIQVIVIGVFLLTTSGFDGIH